MNLNNYKPKNEKQVKKSVFIILISATFIVACGRLPVKVQLMDTATRSPNTGNIEVFKAATEIQKPHRQIATIEAEDKRLPNKLNKDELVSRIVSKAKEIGADGIVILVNEERRRMMPDGMGNSSEQVYLYAKAMAFVYQR